MSEWKEVLLTEITTKIGDGLHGTPVYDNSGEYYFINGNNLVNGKIIIKEDTKRVNESEYLKHAKPLNERTLLLGINGTIGNVAYYKNEKCMLGKSACYISLNNEVDLSFIYYTFISKDFQNYIEGIATGTTIPNVPLKGIREYSFKIPPLPEQRAIASILSSLDDKIDLLHRQNATLEKMAETLFRQWFVEEAGEEWEETTLDRHTEVIRGLSYKGSGLTEEGLGLPMHNLNSVFEGGGYKNQGIKYYSGDYKERHLAFPGDIIVANTEQGHEFRLIGFPAIIPKSFGAQGLFSQHIYRLVLLENTYLSNEYLYYLLMSSDVREQIIAATNGSTVNMLAIDGLRRPVFKLPPQDVVQCFSSVVSNYWQKKDSNQTQIRTLTALRDSLLPKLMSGEVKVESV